MSQIAHDAIRAAQHYKQWGRAATMRYCQKRNVPLRLLTLARQLEGCKMYGLND